MILDSHYEFHHIPHGCRIANSYGTRSVHTKVSYDMPRLMRIYNGGASHEDID